MKTAIFGISYSLELAMALSTLVKCKQCGKCCQEVPEIFIDDSDITRIARYLNKSFKSVKKMMGVKNNKMKTPCVFFKDNSCSIQEVKPIACKIFPLFQHPDRRLALTLYCNACIELHNLLSREKLCLQ